MVNLGALLTLWKRKEPSPASASPPLVPIPTMLVESVPRSTTAASANQAREELKLLKLERQIIGSALTTIYESQTKGLITLAEKDQLVDKYKVELKRLEKSIEERQRVVDVYELETAREDLIKSFKTKLAEIDSQLKNLKDGTVAPPTARAQASEQKPEQKEEKKRREEEDNKEKPSQKTIAKERKPAEDEEEKISNAERRVDQIREEILKAMERLEQIEAEG